MLLKDSRRLSLLIAPTLVLLFITFTIYNDNTIIASHPGWETFLPPHLSKGSNGLKQGVVTPTPGQDAEQPISSEDSLVKEVPKLTDAQEELSDNDELDSASSPLGVASTSAPATHREIFSQSTWDKKFFHIDMHNTSILNPNIIPHPTHPEKWFIVAQRNNQGRSTATHVEIVCIAEFHDEEALRCSQVPTILPIQPTPGALCTGDVEYFNLNRGPHDARVFLGPESPLAVYGTNSQFTCFGQYVQNFQSLVDWNGDSPALFHAGTELQRPAASWGVIEKNWFLFWDTGGHMYAHYDTYPKRAFSQLSPDGSVGPDLSTWAAEEDTQCFARFMPKLGPEHESIHQATNSLAITLCKRKDASCIPNDENTFIFSIFQHKTFYHYHSVYEPYVMVFRQRAPFEVYAISTRPLWIHGREMHPERDTSDMFYITSMSWKTQGQMYHGYMDDELFLAFGIEDRQAAGIDVLAGDILEDLGIC